MYKLFYFVGNVFAKFSEISYSISSKISEVDIQNRSVIKSTEYNMVTSDDEFYYADQYWKIISKSLDVLSSDSIIIDLGCGQGRLSVLLAKQFPESKIYGCDLSQQAIDFANSYAEDNKISNIDFKVEPIKTCLERQTTNSVGIICMTEVTFFYPDWTTDMPKIIDSLRPGGLIVMSFRSLYFFALYLIRNNMIDKTDLLLNYRQGSIFDNFVEYSWQTSNELKILFRDFYNLEILDLVGIGACSGILGDPHDYITRPSLMNQKERDRLMNLELMIGKDTPDSGRYMLLVARKRY